ncbi:MAG: aspartate/glutamate racemase family protein [Roseibium sp.]|uniref:aspartate/glutamate racemase family protein n=1 Tax=Roseibium sp. TaxID=1936156 RepID=UPI0026199A08|nr:aspartate/glutamate racemase family protein [Roseibium sp.]MCV0429193.1 aspartate/glutamate racemase family protein [Roseibium sp.]
MPTQPRPIGLLCLDTHFAKPAGHIRNEQSLPFPVRKAVVKGTSIADLLERPSLKFFEPFLEASRDLERAGCSAITGSCGFMALYQRELTAQVSIPVFASSLIQIPLMHQMSGLSGKVGVITARKEAMTQAHLDAVGAGSTPVVLAGMEDQPEFSDVILNSKRDQIDRSRLGAELMTVGKKLLQDHPDVRSIVLECTDLPPYAYQLQSTLGLPVADLTTLAMMVHSIVTRSAYQGEDCFN